MPTHPNTGGGVLTRFLNEVIAFESMYVTRRTAMTIIATIDQDDELTLDAADIEPVEPPVDPDCVTSLPDAFDQACRSRGNVSYLTRESILL